MILDDRDRSILRLLQAEGRLTNADLAERVSLSASACLRRVRTLEQAGLLDGYVALVNARAVGLGGVAFVLITLNQQGRSALDRFEEAVDQHREILECYLLAGSADYMIKIAYADSQDFERIHTTILTRLPNVVRLHSTLALRTVKKITILPV